MRRPQLLLVGIAAAVVLLICLSLVAWRRQLTAGWEELPGERQRARALGLALSAEELRSRYSNNGNGARARELYMKLDSSPKGDFKEALPLLEGDSTKLAFARDLLRNEAHLFRIAEQAAKLEAMHFEREWELGIATLFPEYSRIKTAGRLLALRATLRAIDGDLNGCLDDLGLIRRAASHCLSDAGHIALLSGLSIENQALSLAASLIRLHPNDNRVKRRLVQIYADPIKTDWRRVVSGEMVMLLENIRDLPKLGDDPLPSKEVSDLLAKDALLLQKAEAKTIRYWRRIYEALAKEQLGEDLIAQLTAVERSDAPDLVHSVLEDNYMTSSIDSYLIPVEVEARRRMLVHHLQGSTAKLIDPIDGQPLRRKGSLYWSPGRDLKDDGGDADDDVVMDFRAKP